MKALSGIFVIFALALTLYETTGCDIIKKCNRDGCTAFSHARSDYHITRGIGGSVADESDVVSEGCQECRFSSAELKVWSTVTPVSDAVAARSVVAGSSAKFTIVAISNYEKELDPGYYLVCSLQNKCASVTVTENGVFTINVKATFGPGSILVFEPGTDTPRTGGIFDIDYESQAGITLTSIAISPADASIVTGATQSFMATGTYNDNSTQNITSSATWTSSDASIAIMSNSGLATAISAGTTTVTAWSGGISDSTTLTVTGASSPTAGHL